MNPPCGRSCPDRSAECHASCDKWKAWEVWKAEEYRQRRLKVESSTISSSVERFILHQQRRNRRQ